MPELFERDRSSYPWALLRSLRPHQWSKNLLLFVPLVAAHDWSATSSWLRLIVLFVAFNLAASAAYLLNDLLDLDSDRRKPARRRRPLAAGTLPLSWGLGAGLVCSGAALTLAGTLGTVCGAIVFCYLVGTTGYSLGLKRVPMLDVLVLASFYAFRLAGGAVASAVALSPWLLALAMFFFLSLATAKRYAELLHQHWDGTSANPARGYRPEDMPQLNILGASSGYLSVLVLVLYVNSDHVLKLYQHPYVIWAICPLQLYWISRLWLLTHRGEFDEDPVVFALKDRVSYVIAGLVLLVGWMAGPL